MAEITKAQWEAKGVELFGEDRTKHRFVCPNCGTEMSIERVRGELAKYLPMLRERGYAIEQECIGRHLANIGCNWAAYGLFRGPLIVDVGDGKTIAAFDYAGKPFTGEGVTRG